MTNVSVLMSVYKNERAEYLNQALQSVWTDQTVKPNQIVLVEDGPLTEALYLVISSWKKLLGDILYIIENEQNLGLTKSLNRGICAINSEYIARMDSDDISLPLRFEKQVNYLETHPDVDVIGGSMQEFNDVCDCLNVRHYPLTHQQVEKYIMKASPLAHPSVMMKKKLFDEGLKYNEKYRTSQDVALWFDVISAGYHIDNLEDIILLFRQNNDVYSRRGRAKAWNECKIYINGIYRLKGLFTWKYIYPLLRLFFRLMPSSIVKFIYESKLRNRLLKR